MTVIATEPLTTTATWTRYEPGQRQPWRRGDVLARAMTSVRISTMLLSYLRLALFAIGLLVGVQVPGFISDYASGSKRT